MSNNIKNLHNSLRERYSGFTVSLEQFSTDMQDESNRKRLHDSLTKRNKNFTVPYEQFSSDMGYGVEQFAEGFGAGFSEGAKGLKEGTKVAVANAANLVTGSSRDAEKALNILDRIDARGELQYFNPRQAAAYEKEMKYERDRDQYKQDLTAWHERNPGLWSKLKGMLPIVGDVPKAPKNPNMQTPSLFDFSGVLPDVDARPYRLVSEALEKGDVSEARRYLKELSQDTTWGDRLEKDAMLELATLKPTKGFGAWVGNLAPQMIPNMLALAAAVHPTTRPLAKPLGGIGIGTLSASSGGMAIAEAREYAEQTGMDVPESDIINAGVLSAGIEAGTEAIPFSRYLSGVSNVVKRRVGKKVTEEILSNPAARKQADKFFVRAAKDIPGLKKISKEQLKKYGGDIVAESVSEFSAESLGAMVPMLYANKEDYPELFEIIENGWEGMKAGAFMGTFLGGGSNMVNNYAQNQRRKQQQNVSLADIGDEVVEVLGVKEKEGTLTVLNKSGEVVDIDKSKVKEVHTVGWNEFKEFSKSTRKDKLSEDALANLTSSEAGIIKQGFDTASQNLEEAMSGTDFTAYKEAILNLGQEDQQAFILDLAEEKTLSENQKSAIADYIIKGNLYKSYTQSFDEKIEDVWADADDLVNSKVNPSMNAVVSARVAGSEDPVQIVQGNIVLNEQGKIDAAQSDQEIYYTDAAGKRQVVSVENVEEITENTPYEEALRRTIAEMLEPVVADAAEQSVVVDNTQGNVQSFDVDMPVQYLNENEELTEGVITDAESLQAFGLIEIDGVAVPLANVVGPVAEPLSSPEGNLDFLPETNNLSTETTKIADIPAERGSNLSAETDPRLVNFMKNEVLAEAEFKPITVGKKNYNWRAGADGSYLIRTNSQKEADSIIENLDLEDGFVAEVASHLETTPSGVPFVKDQVQTVIDGVQVRKAIPQIAETNNEWYEQVAENSTDIGEIVSAYAMAKEETGYEVLMPWEKELLHFEVHPESFYRHGDRNYERDIRPWLTAKRAQQRPSNSIDTIAEELTNEYGVEVTPDMIVDFMLEHPKRKVEIGNEYTRALNLRFKQVARSLAGGIPIGGIETTSGRVTINTYNNLRQKENAYLTPTEEEIEYVLPVQDIIPAEEVDSQAEFDAYLEQNIPDNLTEIQQQITEEYAAEQTNSDFPEGDIGRASSEEINAERTDADMETPGLENPEPARQPSLSEFSGDVASFARNTVKNNEISQAREQVDLNPTEGQKTAGNYKKGHITIQGFDVSIESPKGAVRSGVDEGGNMWSITMQHDYGYLRGTKSRDGDHVDVFVGSHPEGKTVYVIDQINPRTGEFDEHKVMLGFTSQEEAREAYLSNYEAGWQGLGNITPAEIESFREWVDVEGRRMKPFAEYASIGGRESKDDDNVRFQREDWRDGNDINEWGYDNTNDIRFQKNSQRFTPVSENDFNNLIDKLKQTGLAENVFADKESWEKALKTVQEPRLQDDYRQIDKSNYFESTSALFAPIDNSLAKKIMDEYVKYRRKRNKPEFIEVDGEKYTVDFESEKKNAFFESRSLSYYFVTENGKSLIRISDHWSEAAEKYARRRKMNVGFIRSCYWSNPNGEVFDYKVPGQQYSSDLMAGSVDFTEMNPIPPHRLLSRPNGTVYGLVSNNNIYLNPDVLNANTPIHEFGHLWNTFTKQNNSELYNRGAELIKDSPYWEQVNSNPAYANLSEEAKIDEALAMAIGDKGEAAYNSGNVSLYARVKSWLNEVWNNIRNMFLQNNASSLKPQAIQEMTLEEFVEQAVGELLGGKPLVPKISSEGLKNQDKTIAKSGNNDIRFQKNSQRFTPVSENDFNNLIDKLNKTGLASDVITDRAEFNRVLEESTDTRKQLLKNPRSFLTNVRGRWNKNKILKELKLAKKLSSTNGNLSSILKGISSFNNAKELRDHLFYHGTGGGVYGGLYSSITMSERDAERYGGGGYGERYWAISLSKSKKRSSVFSGQSRRVTIYPVFLNKDAKVIERSDIQDSAELEDIIEDLWNEGVDAVKLGDWNNENSEKELAVLNPYAITIFNKPETHQVFGLSQSDIIEKTDKELEEIIDKAKYAVIKSDEFIKKNKPIQPLDFKNEDIPERKKIREEYRQKLSEYQRELSRDIKFLDSNGEVYGFVTRDGNIYLNPDRMNANTPIHEFGHLWNIFTKQNNPELYNRGAKLIKDSPYWEQVNSNPAYANLSEEAKIDEALAMAIGDKGEAAYNSGNISLYARIKNWLNEVWDNIRNVFISATPKGEQKRIKNQDVQNMTLEDFVNNAVGELLSGKSLVNKEQRAKNKGNTIGESGKNANFVNNENGKTNIGQMPESAGGSGGLQGVSAIGRSQTEEGIGRNAEIARRLGSDRPADRSGIQGTRASKSEQEKLLKDYAQEEGIWQNEEAIADNSSIKKPSGKEASVYLSKDGKTITKVVNYDVYSETPSDFVENRILLFNELFPKTTYEIVGFTETDKGFAFVVEQPFISGDLLHNLATNVPSLIEQQKRIENYLRNKYSMNPVGLDAYSNGVERIEDVHLKNVIEGIDGDLYIIDAIPSKENTEARLQEISEMEQIKQAAVNDGTFMKAPNGEPTNLNERQWLQVRTENFKKWFGDWENQSKEPGAKNQENVSKVVDENGEPLVVYHGTSWSPLNEPTGGAVFKGNDGMLGKGTYFSSVYEEANDYAKQGLYNADALSVDDPDEFISDFIFEKGYVGEYYLNVREDLNIHKGVYGSGESTIVMASNPNQIKSATDNIGTFDAGNNDIRFQVEVPLPEYPQRPDLKDYDGDLQKFLQDFEAYKQQKRSVDIDLASEARKAVDRVAGLVTKEIDSQKPVEVLQNFIKKHGGKISEQSDAYSYYFLSKGSATFAQSWFKEKVMSKLIQNINGMIKEAGVNDIDIHWRETGAALTNYEKTYLYLQAKDIQEGKELELPDRGEQAFVEELGMLHTEYIKQFEAAAGKDKVDALWSSVNEATKYSLDLQYKHGLIDKETYDKYQDRKYYVPERGWNTRELVGEQTNYIAKNGPVKGNPYNSALVKAWGRKSLADNPIPYIESIAASTIVSVFKNNNKQRALNLVLENLDYGRKHKLFDFKQIWYVETGGIDADGNKLYKEVYTRPSKDLFDAGVVKTRSNNLHIEQRTRAEKEQHDVFVVKDGKEYLLQFADERVANALNRNMDGTERKWFEETISKGTRALSALMTQYNPSFALWNLARDAGTGVASNLAQFGAGYTGKFVTNMGNPSVHKAIFNYVANGEFDNTSTHGKFLHEFFEDGAATGWSYLKDIDQLRTDLKTAIDPSFVQKLWGSNWNLINLKALQGLFGGMTEYSELIVRFSEYCTSREAGYSRGTSATHAKEVSVNFDRKGTSQRLRSLFAFYNASIQGVNKFVRLAYSSPKARRVLMGTCLSLIVGGFLNTLLAPDDPDEERSWGEYDRMQNILIGNVRIPLPQFLRLFWGFGVQAALGMRGDKTVNKAIYDGVMNAFDESLPMNVVELLVGFDDKSNSLTFGMRSAENLRPVVPTVVGPVYDIWTNSKFTGATVYNEPFIASQENKIPQSFLGKKNVNPLAQRISNGLFKLSGGDPDIKTLWTTTGKVNEPFGVFQNPSAIEHLATGYFPGAGKFVSDVITTAASVGDWTSGEASFDPGVVPVLNRVVKPYREDRVFYNKYFSLKDLTEGYQHGYKARISGAKGGVFDIDQIQQEVNSEAFKLQRESEILLKKIDSRMKLKNTLDELPEEYRKNMPDFIKERSEMNKEEIKEMDALIRRWKKVY